MPRSVPCPVRLLQDTFLLLRHQINFICPFRDAPALHVAPNQTSWTCSAVCGSRSRKYSDWARSLSLAQHLGWTTPQTPGWKTGGSSLASAAAVLCLRANVGLPVFTDDALPPLKTKEDRVEHLLFYRIFPPHRLDFNFRVGAKETGRRRKTTIAEEAVGLSGWMSSRSGRI